MEIIIADYQAMLKKKDELMGLLKELVSVIDTLKYVLNDIDIFWDGEANCAFHLTLNEDFVVMEALCLKLSIAFSQIDAAVSEYAMADMSVLGIVGG